MGVPPKSAQCHISLVLKIFQEEVMALLAHFIPVWTRVSSIHLKVPVPGTGEIRRGSPPLGPVPGLDGVGQRPGLWGTEQSSRTS